MKYDFANREIYFDSADEKKDYENHMNSFGPLNGKSHPDDCPYCAERGWKTFPGTTFEEECDRWLEQHPGV